MIENNLSLGEELSHTKARLDGVEDQHKRKLDAVTTERDAMAAEAKRSRAETEEVCTDRERWKRKHKAAHEKSKYWQNMAQKTRAIAEAAIDAKDHQRLRDVVSEQQEQIAELQEDLRECLTEKVSAFATPRMWVTDVNVFTL